VKIEQFLQITVKVCPKLSEETALIIAEETWEQQGDIRDMISLSKLVKKHDGPSEIAEHDCTNYRGFCLSWWNQFGL
jgi:hypothetical protein